MYHKVFSLAAENKVSGKDQKKLRKSFYRLYPRLSEEDIESLLPSKSESITIAKLKSPHRGTLYLENSLPVILDLTGKGDLIPTLPVLWKYPNLLPKIFVKHFTVSKFILNGADLMLPGVLTFFEGGFLVGTLVSIFVPGNDFPFALGYASMNAMQATQSTNKEGRLVQIIHSYGDLMSRHFSNLEPPNTGFSLTLITPTDESSVPSPSRNNEQTQLDPEEMEFKEEEEEEEEEEEVQDMDQLLNECFFQALQKSVKDKDLPLAAGEFWLKHMYPNRPSGVNIDVKQSSFKKLSKFLQHFTSKEECSLLRLRIDKFSNETIITSINRRHEDYLSFQPYVPLTSVAKGPLESTHELVPELKVDEVYRMGRELNQVLTAVGLDTNCVLTKAEAGDFLFEYVKTAGLDQGVPDHEHIVLDKILGDALFKGRLKKNDKMPEYLLKSQLKEMAMTRMHAQYRIVRGECELLKKGALALIHVTEEKRTGNKHVTRISGLEGFLVDVVETSDIMKKRFACSISLNDAFHKGKKEKEIILQGKKARQILQFIEVELKIPNKYIKCKA